jgi:AraC family transcriptional regulator, transcriptional activator of pobA
MSSLRTFEFHNFLKDIMHANLKLSGQTYFLADAFNFQQTPDYPYRNFFYGVGLQQSGHRRLRVGFNAFDLTPQSLLVIGPDILRQWLDNHAHQSQAIFFTAELFQPPFDKTFLHNLPFFKSNIQHVKPLQNTEYAEFLTLFDTLKQFENQEKLISGLTYALLERTHLLFQADDKAPPAYFPRKHTLVREFQDLVQKHYLEHKDVAYYADQMHLTAKHLSETVKEITGKSAKVWIDDLLIFEAKSLLKQTQMSVKEIVYWLGYEDPSYFNKIFRDTEGVTPLAYRNKQ